MGNIVGAASRRLVVAVSLVLAACATKNIEDDYALSATTGKGVVIGSMARSRLSGSFRLYYRKIGGGEKGYFAYGLGFAQLPSFDKDDFKGPHLKGALFAAELPAGDYEIDDWYVESNSTHTRPAEPFSIRFHVLPGKAVYLGGFIFERTDYPAAASGIAVGCRDERSRDMQIFAAKYPNLAETEIASSIEESRSYENIGNGSATRVTIDIPIINPPRR